MNESVQIAAARRNFMLFSSAVFPALEFATFHIAYYRILQAFAERKFAVIFKIKQHKLNNKQSDTSF